MKTRNSHGLLQLGREALAYCQCLYRENKALFVSVDLIGEKNQVILELSIKDKRSIGLLPHLPLLYHIVCHCCRNVTLRVLYKEKGSWCTHKERYVYHDNITKMMYRKKF